MVEWSDFPIKNLIVNRLDYESRCNLRLCSKADQTAVDNTKFVPDFIEIEEVPSEMVLDKTMIRVGIDSFSIWFTGVNGITKVDRAWNKEMSHLEERKAEPRHDVARRYLDNFFRKHVIEARKITIRLLEMKPSENWTLKCNILNVFHQNGDPDWALDWLRKVGSPLRSLHMQHSNLNGIRHIPQVLNVTESLILTDGCDLNGRDLEDLSVTTLDVTSFFVTFHTIRVSLERYLRIGRKSDYMNFEIPLPTDEFFNPLSLLPPGIIMRNVKRGASSAEFRGCIVGGYTNEVGNQRDLRFECVPYGRERLTISIQRDDPQTYREHPLPLYPFTSRW